MMKILNEILIDILEDLLNYIGVFIINYYKKYIKFDKFFCYVIFIFERGYVQYNCLWFYMDFVLLVYYFKI